MFTLEQMKTAHAKVKTGKDFPKYIREIKGYGLKRYVFSVIDGSTTYYGENGHEVASKGMYAPKAIAEKASPDGLRHTIAVHQQGATTFLEFCEEVATEGVKQWVIDTDRMLCTYEDMEGKEMVAEPIPEAL
jgi:uncharacterized protein YbcV (DUF1398 family)